MPDKKIQMAWPEQIWRIGWRQIFYDSCAFVRHCQFASLFFPSCSHFGFFFFYMCFSIVLNFGDLLWFSTAISDKNVLLFFQYKWRKTKTKKMCCESVRWRWNDMASHMIKLIKMLQNSLFIGTPKESSDFDCSCCCNTLTKK